MAIRIFQERELREAIQYALDGGQALHLHQFLGAKPPKVFVAAVNRGEHIAHLFDQDRDRLIATAKTAGIRVIYIDREGTDRQHIDACAGPLQKLIAQARQTDGA